MKITALFILTVLMAPVAVARAQDGPQTGTVTVAVGEVLAVTEENQAGAPVEKGDKVVIGTTIKTGAGARAVIVITPRSAIRIAENSEVVIETIDQAATPSMVMIDLKDGSLGALLKPNAATELDFRVRTPSGVAAARGTFYAVAVKDGKGYTQVKEGKVEIIPNEDAEN